MRSCQKSISSRKTAFGVTFVSFRNGLSVGRQLIWKEAPGRVVRRQIATSGLTESISALSPPLRCHLCLPLRPNLPLFSFFCTTQKQLPCSAAHADRRANRTGRMLKQICRHQIFFFFFFPSSTFCANSRKNVERSPTIKSIH